MEVNLPVLRNRKTIRNAMIYTAVITLVVSAVVFFLFHLWGKSVLVQEEAVLRRGLIKEVTIARNMVDPVIQDFNHGAITREEGLLRMSGIMRSFTFEDQYDANYVFLVLYDGTMLVQPINPQNEGTNQWDAQDSQGNYYIRDISLSAQQHPEGGFIEYNINSPLTGQEEKKISYVIGVPEMQVLIGSGIYIREIYDRQRVIERQAVALSVGTIFLIALPVLLALYRLKQQNDVVESEINRRQKAEQSLACSEERLRLALESSNEGWWDWNIASGRTFYSQHYYELLGLSPSEGNYSSVLEMELVHPDDREKVKLARKNLLQKIDQSSAVEYRFFMPDGGIRWIRSVGKVVEVDREGNATRIVGTITDVSEAKKAAQALADSEANLRAVFDNTHDGILIHDPDGKVLECNSRAIELIGLPFEEIRMADDVLAISNPQESLLHRQMYRGYWDKVFKGNAVSFDYQLLNNESQIYTDTEVTLTQTIWYGKDAVLAVIHDLTQQKAAERALFLSQEKLRGVVDQLYEGLMLVDQHGRVLEWNPAMESLTGILQREAQGQLAWDIRTRKAQGYQALSKEEFLKAFRSKKMAMFSRSIEIHQLAQDGRQRILQQTLFPVVIGEEMRVGATLVDVTEQKQYEERIQAELAKIDALRKIDISIASHQPIEETIKVIFEQTQNMLQVDAICLMLIDEKNNLIRNAYNIGIDKHLLHCPFYSVRSNKGGLAEMLSEGNPVWYPAINRPEKYGFCSCAEEGGFKTFAAAPILTDEKAIGFFEVFLKAEFTPSQEWLDYLVVLAGQTAIALDSQRLYSNLQSTNQALVKSYESTIKGWSKALELKDKETKGHSDRVMQLACELAKYMGYSDEQMKHFRYGVLLHDIGKMGIPDSILLKPGPLSMEEWEIMRQHPVMAYNLLHGIDYLERSLDIPYSHHERWNGSGYPQGLKGEDIPLGARIFAVVDVWDALTSERPYRSPLPDEEAMQYIVDNAGVQFDPAVVEQFKKMMG